MTLTLALLLALVISAIGVGVSRRWRLPGQMMIGLGCLGMLGVVVLQVRQNVFPPEPKPPGRCEMAVSATFANFIVRDSGAQGGSVILLFPDRRGMDENTERSYEEGFALPLRHGPRNVQLKALHLEAAKGKAGYDVSSFSQAMQQAPRAQAFVSYAGAPTGFEALFAGQAKAPLFYVFDPDGTTNWLAGLKAGQVRAVVLPRPGVSPRDREGAAGMPQDIFERFYLLATPQNADQVAAQVVRK